MSKFAALTTKKARIAYIREAVEKDQRWAGRALVRIWENQTEDEQHSDTVTDHNGIGFTVHDANLLSSYAKQYQERGTLSPKQWAYVHKLMPKYARQLEGCIT